MRTQIGVESLAANALIELYVNGKNPQISFKQLGELGLIVMSKYQDETKEEAYLVFDHNAIIGFVFDYSEFFEIIETDQKYIKLRDNVKIDELKEHFRWTLSYAMLRVLNDVNITGTLGQMIG